MDRIYVAGFDVFYPDWKGKRYFEYQELCRKYDFEMQAQKAAPNEGRTLGEKVFLKNIHYIDSSDYVVANLNPFRGREPDSGTCFEIGCLCPWEKDIRLSGGWPDHDGEDRGRDR